MSEQDTPLTWHVSTHEHRGHSVDWYWTFGLITLVGAGACVYFDNFLLALILVLGVGSIIALSIRGPREHSVTINKRGVSLDGTTYPFTALRTFWVEQETETPRLFLTTKSMLVPRIVVPLDNAELGTSVRTYLARHIEEEEQLPHLGENLAEMIGL